MTDEVLKIYEAALKDYANPDHWVRGIVYSRPNVGRVIKYGMEVAENALKEGEKIKEGNE